MRRERTGDPHMSRVTLKKFPTAKLRAAGRHLHDRLRRRLSAQALERRVDLLFGDRERRQQADGGRTRRVDDQTLFEQQLLREGARVLDFERNDQATSADAVELLAQTSEQPLTLCGDRRK